LEVSPQIPSGLRYWPDFILQSCADALLAFVDATEWDRGMKRRVQHYGWRYDYRAGRVNSNDYLGPLPSVFAELANKIGENLSAPTDFDQVIVNEYLPGQGISVHIDCLPCFGPIVASISLCSTCEMVFQHSQTKARSSLVLRPLSLLTLEGPARSEWSHAIPARRSDFIAGQRIARSRRVSLTFRTKVQGGL
jgi:alkylated DNA repair dioxygenase AlkB